MSKSNVIPFRQKETGGTPVDAPIAAVELGRVTDGATAQAVANARLRDLYPLPAESMLDRAFSLLLRSRELVEEADEHFRDGNFIGSDDALVRLRFVMQELFLCRAVGPGFAQIIVGVSEGLRQLQPETLSKELFLHLHRTIEIVREHPALSIDAAIELLMTLDDDGMCTDMPELGALADIGETNGPDAGIRDSAIGETG